MNDVTQILLAVEHGEASASEELLPLVYSELRRLAAQKLANEKPGQTLDATGLVHEAYLRLVPRVNDVRDHPHWDGRRHFFAAAAEAMRRILIDRARAKRSLKAGGGRRRVDLDEVDVQVDVPITDLLAIDEALDKLEKTDKVKADLVKLRFFAGLTNAQAAQALGISASTADNYWAYARSWLRLEVEGRTRR
jgi:RNA polymerase sigma factor (TIGR02999 family)